MNTMHEVETTCDEYGMKAGGVLSNLEKFDTLCGLCLAHLLLSAAEDTTRPLQGKDTSVQKVLSAVNLLKEYLDRQRRDASFDKFYNAPAALADGLELGKPTLPRY